MTVLCPAGKGWASQEALPWDLMSVQKAMAAPWRASTWWDSTRSPAFARTPKILSCFQCVNYFLQYPAASFLSYKYVHETACGVVCRASGACELGDRGS